MSVPSSRMPAFDFSSWYALFFIAFVIVNTYIFMSLFLAVVYNNYKKHLKVMFGGVNCDWWLPAVLYSLVRKYLAFPWKGSASGKCGEGHTASYLCWCSANNKTGPPFVSWGLLWVLLLAFNKNFLWCCGPKKLQQIGSTCLCVMVVRGLVLAQKCCLYAGDCFQLAMSTGTLFLPLCVLLKQRKCKGRSK